MCGLRAVVVGRVVARDPATVVAAAAASAGDAASVASTAGRVETPFFTYAVSDSSVELAMRANRRRQQQLDTLYSLAIPILHALCMDPRSQAPSASAANTKRASTSECQNVTLEIAPLHRVQRAATTGTAGGEWLRVPATLPPHAVGALLWGRRDERNADDNEK